MRSSVREKLSRSLDYHQAMIDHHKERLKAQGIEYRSPQEKLEARSTEEPQEHLEMGEEHDEGDEQRQKEDRTQDHDIIDLHADAARQLNELLEKSQATLVLDRVVVRDKTSSIRVAK